MLAWHVYRESNKGYPYRVAVFFYDWHFVFFPFSFFIKAVMPPRGYVWQWWYVAY